MNVAVGFDVKKEKYSIQTRATVVSNVGVKDNTGTLGFFKNVNIERMFDKVREVLACKFGVIPTNNILIAGERCGGSVQKHVGLTKLDNLFIVFDVFADGKWYSSHISAFVSVESPDENIYHMDRFSSHDDVYILDTSVNMDDASLPPLIQEATNRVDATCSILKYFLPGVEGCGEGLVWTPSAESYIELLKRGFTDDDIHLLRFKTKGTSHLGPPPEAAAEAKTKSLKLLNSYATPSVCDDIILKFNFAPVKKNIKEFGDKFVADVMESIQIDLGDALTPYFISYTFMLIPTHIPKMP